MKKVFKLTLLAAIALFVAASCTGNKKSNESTDTDVVDMHTSEISLDWAGTYSGVLPCASCEGIETELTLNQDGTYKLYTNYRVEENQVRHLDLEGNAIEGDLETFYILTKEGNPVVEDQRWELVELNGKAVEGDAETHYIIFHSADNRLEAKADCNVLQYNYRIKHQMMLEMEQGLSTLMACPEGSIEDEYREVLNTVDNLSCDGETLTLNKARMAPLAVFKLAQE